MWADSYMTRHIPWRPLGRDISGLDCWGLVSLVFSREHGIALESFTGAYTSAEEREDIARIVAGEKAGGPWRRVEAGNERAFDVAVFSCGGLESHVGVVTEPGRFIHASPGVGVVQQSYRDGRWARRFKSAWRHILLA